MNSIVNYSSDENSDEDNILETSNKHGQSYSSSKSNRKVTNDGDNYEEVGMDLSEDSNGSAANRYQMDDDKYKHDREDNSKSYRKNEDSSTSRSRNGSRSPKCKKEGDEKLSRSRDEDRYNRYKRDDRRGDSERYRNRRPDDRSRERDKYRDSKDTRRDRYSRDDKYNRDRYYDRKRSSRSRDRSRRSRSRDDRRGSPSSRRTRSRSNSKDRTSSSSSSIKMSYIRRDKGTSKMNRLDKLGIEFNPANYPTKISEDTNYKHIEDHTTENILMPSLTGRFREQIEKRKQMWQKGKSANNETPSNTTFTSSSSVNTHSIPFTTGNKAAKVYEATTFADDKTSNKFKRLMGIKDSAPHNLPTKTSEVLKKQEEMFSSMEAQYEVARTATHTMRGVGLGFGSYQKL